MSGDGTVIQEERCRAAVGEGCRSYLEPRECGVEVVEGQDTVVDCQEAEEPGRADQQEQQEGAAEGPAARTREITRGHAHAGATG